MPAFLFASAFLSRDHSNYPDQKNRANECDDDRSDEAAGAA